MTTATIADLPRQRDPRSFGRYDAPVTEARSTGVVNAFIRAHHAGRVAYHGVDTLGRYSVAAIDGPTRVFELAGAEAWWRGFELGESTHRLKPISNPRRGLDQVRQVLVAPTLADALRVRIRAAMDAQGLGVVELAALAGHTRKAISDALHYGYPGALSVAMAERLMSALGVDVAEWLGYWYGSTTVAEAAAAGAWDLRYLVTGSPDDPVAGPATIEHPEPAGLTRVRALCRVQEAGLIRWTGPVDDTGTLSPDRAQRATRFTLTRGRTEHQVDADVVVWFLLGMCDYLDEQLAATLHR